MTTPTYQELAAEARAASARCYRRARKCDREAQHWQLAADAATHAAVIAQRDVAAAWDRDRAYAQMCAERAGIEDRIASVARRLVEHCAEWAPRWREAGAAAMNEARQHEQAARLQMVGALPEGTE